MAWPTLHCGLQEADFVLQVIKMDAMARVLLRLAHLADLSVELIEQSLLITETGRMVMDLLHHALHEIVYVRGGWTVLHSRLVRLARCEVSVSGLRCGNAQHGLETCLTVLELLPGLDHDLLHLGIVSLERGLMLSEAILRGLLELLEGVFADLLGVSQILSEVPLQVLTSAEASFKILDGTVRPHDRLPCVELDDTKTLPMTLALAPKFPQLRQAPWELKGFNCKVNGLPHVLEVSVLPIQPNLRDVHALPPCS
jgi:hypothetical protein